MANLPKSLLARSSRKPTAVVVFDRRQIRIEEKERQTQSNLFPVEVKLESMSDDTTAKLNWQAVGRVRLKLKKANGDIALNAVYGVGPLPDDLTLLDDDDDPITNASFVDIQQHFSIEYNGTQYHFNDPIQDRRKNEPAVAGPIAVAGPPAAGAPPSTPKSRDIYNQIAAVFEGEVNMHLEDYFQSVLPGCKFSRFKSREIDDDNTALEMDSFSYMPHDTLEPPQTNNALGIYVVQPKGMNKKKPKGANSPGAKAANLGRHAEKYAVGESYSGDREDRIKGKVHQLEEKLDKMKQRHSIQSHAAVSDVTSLFGAAILSFTCQSLPRKNQSRKCMKAVLEELSSTQTPILWRLARAERFFIVVLSTREGANTRALREITRGIQGVEIGIQAILGRLDEKAGEERNEEIGGEEHQY
jgi:hypothetical protein